jgi:hypothetical protein
MLVEQLMATGQRDKAEAVAEAAVRIAGDLECDIDKVPTNIHTYIHTKPRP